MEKLGQLKAAADSTGEWDLIIVDTPPSRSALDFLDAPKRLGSFLDGRLMKVLSAPARGAGKFGAKVMGAGLSVVTGTLTKIIGAQVLRDLQTFVTSFDALFGGFRQRAEATYAQLASSRHSVPRGRGTRTGCVARSVVLRGAVSRREDAARRTDPQPSAGRSVARVDCRNRNSCGGRSPR